MAGKQSWAEGHWWRGTVFDWLGVLLAIAIVFVLAFVSVPFLLLRHIYGIPAKQFQETLDELVEIAAFYFLLDRLAPVLGAVEQIVDFF